MKMLVSILVLLSALQVRAEEVVWTPSQTRKVLKQAEEDGQIERMKQLLTPEMVETLQEYQNLPDDVDLTQNNAKEAIFPVLAGAFVAGAAVAVVEHYWDRVVGNGKNASYVVDPKDFDISTLMNQPMDPMHPQLAPPTLVLKNNMGASDYIGMNPYNYPVQNVDNNWGVYDGTKQLNDPKVALTPLMVVVAEATAGAVGYKAAQYLLNRYGSAMTDTIIVPPNYFDLPLVN